ncbi:MAG: FlgD immunoglobulin-like domain containing protein, partial [Candidatus Krumholzibacteriota bacterium]
DVTDLMNPGRDEVQVQLTVYELGWIWHWHGDDGYPAPYFDDVTVKVFPYLGPAITVREIDLAQDNFPEQGTIDLADLGSNHVRFDMARNISLASHLRNDPGDSIIATIKPVRAGAVLAGYPELHYCLEPNPLFDPYRGGLPPTGSVAGFPVYNEWGFDLPDTGFLFPGDVLHYYISATDAIGGPGGSDPQTALIPPDTTGFSTDFHYPMGYNSSFTVRALPTMRDDGFGGLEQPEVLFINDYADLGGENKWYTALTGFGMYHQDDYDIYYVNGPTSGVGNGIGGRATAATLAGYSEILYTSGDLKVHTISNGDFNRDPGDDVGVLTGWLDLGEKDMFLTGDNLASDLAAAGPANQDFLENYMGVTLANFNVRPLIQNQTSPRVAPVYVANPDRIFYHSSTWVAYGGCPDINMFDAVQTRGSAVREAEFLDVSGHGGFFSYSAVTLNRVGTSRIVSMPLDLMYVITDPNTGGSPLSGRGLLLRDVLNFFGIFIIINDVPDDLPGIAFQAVNFPNPFNPSTTIKYSLPKAGHLKLSVYNVRGQLVKTLIDGPRPAGAGQTVVWDGSDNLGSAAASGVYFYEARAHGDVRIGKTTLLK